MGVRLVCLILILFLNLGCDQFLKNWVGNSSSPGSGVTSNTVSFLGVLGQPDAYTNIYTPLKYGSPFSLVAIGTKFAMAVPDHHRVLIWNSFPADMSVPADVVLGQPDLYSIIPNYGGISAKSMNRPFFVSSDGTRLFVAEQNNNRVLIWNTIPTVSYTPADVVLGQPDFTSNKAFELGLFQPTSGFILGTKLLVAENANHRVLVWNSIPVSNQQKPDLVLGQPDLSTNIANYPNMSKGLNSPDGICSNGSNLVIVDYLNNRVLIWNSFPTSNGQMADIVLGQPNFYSNVANNGGVIAKGLNNPVSCYIKSGKLYVADRLNNRILIWNTFPTQNYQAADLVLGQPNFTSNLANNGGVSGTSLNSPEQVCFSGSNFLVSDRLNNRVLIWNTEPTSNTIPADRVLGQSSLSANAVNSGGLSVKSLSSPYGVSCDSSNVYVADGGNHRTLIWNGIPSVDFASASLVLGQPLFTTNTANNGGASAQTMNSPVRPFSDGTRLLVSDYFNNRLLYWSSIPVASQAAATLTIGQVSGGAITANKTTVNANNLNLPTGVITDGTKLFVGDIGNSRVLVWNSIPAVNYQAADYVLGQPDLVTGNPNTGGVTSQSMYGPSGMAIDSGKLFVGDTYNHRILIWNTIPTVTQASANVVLGQSTFNTNAANFGGLSAQSMQYPFSFLIDSGKLFLPDYYNSRILIWNTVPTASFAAANVVLGQPSFTVNTANNGGISASTMFRPASAMVHSGKLVVTDTWNHRVLLWNSVPTASGAAADQVIGQTGFTGGTSANTSGKIDARTISQSYGILSYKGKFFVSDYADNRLLIWNSFPTDWNKLADIVLGQPSFQTSSGNNGGISSQTLYGPARFTADNNKLIVPDQINHRVLIWNSIPTTNQQAADVVLGQPNMASNSVNNGGLSAKSFNIPTSTLAVNGSLFISDLGNNRVLIWNTVPTSNFVNADLVLGQNNFTTGTANGPGLGSKSLSGPTGLTSNGTKFAVVDNSNHRILIWNSMPSVSSQAADVVVGQPDFTTNTINTGGQSAKTLRSPDSVLFYKQKLIISDAGNRRVLIWNQIPTSNFASADLVIGQPDFTSNESGTSANRFKLPTAIWAENDLLYVSDVNNNRILVYQLSP